MDDERWSGLLQEHHLNVERLTVEAPEPPSLWGLAIGLLVPWVAVALAWLSPTAALPLIAALVVLIPVGGLLCLCVEELQIVTVGLVLGSLSATLAVQQLFL